jgi:hypothetical protein
MFELQNDVVFNRALLSNRAIDSSALTVRGALLHVFKDPGDHDVTIHRDGRPVGRIAVDVVAGSGPSQVNLDLTSLEGADRLSSRHAVRAGGVVGFSADLGSGRYALVANHTSGEVSRTVLDSREGLPAGDLFAVTLVLPGAYRARNLHNQTDLEFLVHMPRQGEPYSPAQPTLVQVGEHGFDPGAARILAGQSLVFLVRTPARLVVEPIQTPAP